MSHDLPCSAKTVELIKLTIRILSEVSQRNRVLDALAHWRHLANAVERLCEWVFHQGWQRGLFPNNFGVFFC